MRERTNAKTEYDVCAGCGKGYWHSKVSGIRYCSRRCAAIANRRKIPSSFTQIERIIRDKLDAAGLMYKMQEPLEGITLADFYLPAYKTVIYCDGKYWHNLPGALEKDMRQTKTLTEKGYTVFRFGEDEIINSASTLIDRINNHILNYHYNYREMHTHTRIDEKQWTLTGWS